MLLFGNEVVECSHSKIAFVIIILCDSVKFILRMQILYQNCSTAIKFLICKGKLATKMVLQSFSCCRCKCGKHLRIAHSIFSRKTNLFFKKRKTELRFLTYLQFYCQNTIIFPQHPHFKTKNSNLNEKNWFQNTVYSQQSCVFLPCPALPCPALPCFLVMYRVSKKGSLFNRA